MYEKPVIELPRTAPDQEPINMELIETENTFEGFSEDLIDPNDSIPEIEMPFQTVRGPAVRAPIYANPESRPERTLPRAAREQIARSTAPKTDLGENPFEGLMKRFNG